MAQKFRIAIDMDEVIADSLSRYLLWYERDFGEKFPIELLKGKKPREVVSAEKQEIVRAYPRQVGFFRDLPLIEGGQAALKWLSEHHEVFITTAAMEFKHSFVEKYEWMQAHYPFIHWRNIVFCGDKSIIRADYMIDDNAFNLETFQGTGILFTALHNAHETRFLRKDSWKDILDYFSSL